VWGVRGGLGMSVGGGVRGGREVAGKREWRETKMRGKGVVGEWRDLVYLLIFQDSFY